MNTNKVMTKSASVQVATCLMVEKQQELIRGLHELLTLYAPVWYTENMDTRLAETIAKFTAPSSHTQNQ